MKWKSALNTAILHHFASTDSGNNLLEENIFKKSNPSLMCYRSIRVAERLALPTSDHGGAGSNHAGGEILPEPKRRFIAQSLSCSPFHRLEMTEILLKGCKTLTHPSISCVMGWIRLVYDRSEVKIGLVTLLILRVTVYGPTKN